MIQYPNYAFYYTGPEIIEERRYARSPLNPPTRDPLLMLTETISIRAIATAAKRMRSKSSCADGGPGAPRRRARVGARDRKDLKARELCRLRARLDSSRPWSGHRRSMFLARLGRRRRTCRRLRRFGVRSLLSCRGFCRRCW